MYRTSAVGTEERKKANTNSLRGGWNEKFTDRNYVKKRSQNHSNTDQIQIEIGTLKIVTVGDIERWRNCVSNKEISNEKVEKGCTTIVDV